MRDARVAKCGDGSYPNNVCSYLLNQNHVSVTTIKGKNRQFTLIWEDIENSLPSGIRKAVSLVFKDGYTFKEAGTIMGVSGTTVRNYIHSIYKMVDNAGYVLQPLWCWALTDGHTMSLTNELILDTWEKYHFSEISLKQVTQLYDLLKTGLAYRSIARILKIPYASFQRFYSLCIGDLLKNNEYQGAD